MSGDGIEYLILVVFNHYLAITIDIHVQLDRSTNEAKQVAGAKSLGFRNREVRVRFSVLASLGSILDPESNLRR